MINKVLVFGLNRSYQKKRFIPFVRILFIILSMYCCLLHARDDIEKYTLPKNHPLQSKLKTLFANSEMFNSIESFSNNGFEAFPRVHRGFMVASHPTIKNYLFKKFQNSISSKDQLKNYLTRIKGARILAKFILSNNLQHIVVPQKWLYALPKQFNDKDTNKTTYILIVEKLDLCSGWTNPFGDLAQKYLNMPKDILKELCLVLYHFRGLDSMIHNMPFTYQNKIAFIDTEKWNIERKGYLSKAMPFLSKENQDFALSLFQQFEQNN